MIRYYDSGRRELFNLADDLGETKDLAGARPEETEQLDKRLSAWLSSVGAKLPKPDPNFKPASRRQ